MRGWLGGACAEPTVVREALKALEEGSPRLLFLGPPEELEGRARDGVVTVPIACQSEGALEVYVEPVLPQPQLVAIGRSPAAHALAALAAGLGWRSVLVDDGGDAADIRTSARRLARPVPRCRRAVVRGRGDAGSLRRGRAGARARDAGRLRRPGRVPQARGGGARLPARSRGGGRRARARPRPGRAGPRPRVHRRDRRGDPGRDRAAAGGRDARGRRGPATGRASRATRRSTPSAA